MKIDIEKIIAKVTPWLEKFKRYMVFSFILGFLLIYSFLVLRINLLISSEPSQDDYNSRLHNVQRPKIDKNALNKIQSLQDQHIQVQALFKQARDNPFSE
ncbi:MAG TPA: hypothetical protein VLF39_02775 [Candidatus Saccharimonadales bacterium]|nr:hypothetical protein [Candidatus Saccharimonadales bacterium]